MKLSPAQKCALGRVATDTARSGTALNVCRRGPSIYACYAWEQWGSEWAPCTAASK